MTMKRWLTLIGICCGLLTLTTCAEHRKKKPSPDRRSLSSAPDQQRGSLQTKPLPVDAERRKVPRDAGGPGPLVLQGLSVTGFEQAELKESDEQKRHWGKVSTRTWSVRKGQQWKRVAEIQLGRRSPRNLAGYLRHWLTHRGCVAKKVRDLPPTQRDGVTPPQLTFKGRCKGGDAFFIRVLLLREVAYELHADSFRGAAGVRASFLELLSAVKLLPTTRGTTRLGK